jgi:hypothetical protein
MPTLTLHRLLTRGYFPEELPPPFSTAAFAGYVSRQSRSAFPFAMTPKLSQPEIFYQARTGTLRRPLAILNPVHFAALANFIVSNWSTLRPSATKSLISLTSPQVGAEGRAIGRKLPFQMLAEQRARLRSTGRYLVRADISRFYQSIYTHAVPWALYGRAFAKRNKRANNTGNKLDELLRGCQDGQTNGVPMGPDSSLLIAEMILSAVDDRLKKYAGRAIRYMDDYELIADTEGEALRLLADLQHELLKFELHLNPSKTRVQALPCALEERWTAPLREHPLDPASKTFKAQVLRFFDTAFDLSQQFPTSAVIKYAIGRLANLNITDQHELIEDLLLQSARIEPGTLDLVLRLILNNPKQSSRKLKRADLLINTILQHAPQRHSSEVAWSIWACIVLRIQLPPEVIKAILGMEDSVCALLLLHAMSAGLASAKRATRSLEAVMTGDELYDRRWLLSYEANVKGWVKCPADHVAKDVNFAKLKAAQVEFYDPTALAFMPRGSQRRVVPSSPGSKATISVENGAEENLAGEDWSFLDSYV